MYGIKDKRCLSELLRVLELVGLRVPSRVQGPLKIVIHAMTRGKDHPQKPQNRLTRIIKDHTHPICAGQVWLVAVGVGRYELTTQLAQADNIYAF